MSDWVWIECDESVTHISRHKDGIPLFSDLEIGDIVTLRTETDEGRTRFTVEVESEDDEGVYSGVVSAIEDEDGRPSLEEHGIERYDEISFMEDHVFVIMHLPE